MSRSACDPVDPVLGWSCPDGALGLSPGPDELLVVPLSYLKLMLPAAVAPWYAP
jgi:hypothetical protein